MDVLETKELQKEVPVATMAIVIGSLFVGAMMGFFIAKSITEASYQDKIQTIQHGFAFEVQGLRSDMRREVEILERRLEKLEK
jgi:NADH:ubiquinone oxidoreductase subunit 5 (subunit L)/multisubunit Na+/H+ antiporter MnhA subunit